MDSIENGNDTEKQRYDEPEPPLTANERLAIRKLLERERRAAWLYANLRIWALWVSAMIGAATLGWDFVKRILKAAVN